MTPELQWNNYAKHLEDLCVDQLGKSAVLSIHGKVERYTKSEAGITIRKITMLFREPEETPRSLEVVIGHDAKFLAEVRVFSDWCETLPIDSTGDGEQDFIEIRKRFKDCFARLVAMCREQSP